jgi:peptide/nickel transport system permease protein
MVSYIVRRIGLLVPLFIGITLITFIVINLAPGRPTDIVEFQAKVSPEIREKFIKLYNLDKPLLERYILWVSRVVRLDFGSSFKDDRPVMRKILERLPATLLLNILSLGTIFCISLPIGIYSAVKHGSLFDKSMTVFVFIGFSLPTFWLAIILMILFGIKLGWLPISGMRSLYYSELSFWEKVWDIVKHLILPVLVSSFSGLAGLSRYMRASMLEVLHQDYIRTARAKGLPENKVILKHALKNALLPVVTILGLSLPELIGGSFIFETIFAWPGMGRLGYEAVMMRDYPTIMGVGTIAAALTLLGNLLADITYAYVDPRIRYK